MRGAMWDSLDGLSVGDALGAAYFVPGNRVEDLLAGRVPAPVWDWTDDTEMACSVVAELESYGAIDRDRLAAAFAERCEPFRGYGGGAVVTLHQIRDGAPWHVVAPAAFGGSGSLGNGAAMRVAPLGAFFADDLDRAALEAIKSAEVTHAHPEAISGAVAVAVATARVAGGVRRGFDDFLDLPHVIAGRVADGIAAARELRGASVAEAAYRLGNGASVLAHETVPFTLWVAARFLGDYPAAIRACIEAGGDIDTTAAIAGGIVAACAGVGTPGGVPASWLAAREPLPAWLDAG